MTYSTCVKVRARTETCARIDPHFTTGTGLRAKGHCDACGRSIQKRALSRRGVTLTEHAGPTTGQMLHALNEKRKAGR